MEKKIVYETSNEKSLDEVLADVARLLIRLEKESEKND